MLEASVNKDAADAVTDEARPQGGGCGRGGGWCGGRHAAVAAKVEVAAAAAAERGDLLAQLEAERKGAVQLKR